MWMWTRLFGWSNKPTIPDINPATGLPMVGDVVGGLDVAGNPYGVDVSAYAIDSACDAGSHFEVGSEPGGGLGNDWAG